MKLLNLSDRKENIELLVLNLKFRRWNNNEAYDSDIII